MVRKLILSLLLTIPMLGRCQVAYEGQRAPFAFTVGGSYSYFNADYAGNHLGGITTYGDVTPFVFEHVGMQTEARWLFANGSRSFREYNYLAGPSFHLPIGERKGLHPYVKTLAGKGVIDFPNHLAYGRYVMFAFGGGTDFALTHRWKLRADYEYQVWPNAPGIPGITSPALKPAGLTLGATYRVF